MSFLFSACLGRDVIETKICFRLSDSLVCSSGFSICANRLSITLHVLLAQDATAVPGGFYNGSISYVHLLILEVG